VKRIVIGFLAVAFLFPMAIMAEGTKEAANKEVVLKWPCIWVGKDTKAPEVAKLVDEFNVANAGKIKVEIESQPDYDGYEQKIRTSIAAGMVPDIFTIKLNPTTAEYYKSDLLMDFSSELTGAWKDSFKAGTLDQATIGGALKSIPYEIAITPIWYNEDLLKKAGVSYPKTVDEMWTVFDKLKAAGITPASQMTGGGPAYATTTMGIQLYNKMDAFKYGEASAIGAVLIFFGTVVIVLIRAFLSKGDPMAEAEQ